MSRIPVNRGFRICRSPHHGLAIAALAMLLAAIPVYEAIAHGTHVRFMYPDSGQIISNKLEIRIAEVEHQFPYVFIEIKPHYPQWERRTRVLQTDPVLWSGLVPVGETGYHQEIKVSGWPEGQYIVEAQFIGDIVENIQSRRFVVEH